MLNRRTFFAAIGAVIAGAKAKVLRPRPTLTINRNPQFLTSVLNSMHHGPKIGDTITISKPPRFVMQDGAADLNMDVLSEMYIKPAVNAVKTIADEIDNDILRLARERFRSANEITKAYDAQLRADFELICGPVPVKVYAEPSGDIPLASSCECEEYEDWAD